MLHHIRTPLDYDYCFVSTANIAAVAMKAMENNFMAIPGKQKTS